MKTVPATRRTRAPRRRRLQYSLRTLLLAVAVLSVGLGYHAHRVRKQRMAVRRIQELGGRYFYDWRIRWAESLTPDWLLDLAGPDHFQTVVHVNLDGTRITDEQVAFLRDLPHLETLYVESGTQVTDAGLAHLKRLSSLKNLYLPKSITDAGLEDLGQMRQLETLILSNSQVTDAGLAHLYGLKNLKWVYIDGTNVTLEGATKLKQHLPNTRITFIFGDLTL